MPLNGGNRWVPQRPQNVTRQAVAGRVTAALVSDLLARLHQLLVPLNLDRAQLVADLDRDLGVVVPLLQINKVPTSQPTFFLPSAGDLGWVPARTLADEIKTWLSHEVVPLLRGVYVVNHTVIRAGVRGGLMRLTHNYYPVYDRRNDGGDY